MHRVWITCRGKQSGAVPAQAWDSLTVFAFLGLQAVSVLLVGFPGPSPFPLLEILFLIFCIVTFRRNERSVFNLIHPKKVG